MQRKNAMEFRDLDDFTKAYIECALWSTNDNMDDSGGESLDANYTSDDFTPATLTATIVDCARFQRENAMDIDGEEEQAGHDFWLTRNHHGAGFWDGDWCPPLGQRLTEACKDYDEVNLYVGDDGLIYC
jgi:hypothetical protein